MLCLVAQICLTLCDSMDCSPPGSSIHGNSPEKNTGVGCHALFRGNLPNPRTEPWSPALQVDSLQSEPTGKPQLKHALDRYNSVIGILYSLWIESIYSGWPDVPGNNASWEAVIICYFTGASSTPMHLCFIKLQIHHWNIPETPGSQSHPIGLTLQAALFTAPEFSEMPWGQHHKLGG